MTAARIGISPDAFSGLIFVVEGDGFQAAACVPQQEDQCLTSLPPGGFVAPAMHFAVVGAAQRHGEFIAHLAAKRTQLREAQMVRIRRMPPADQARLFDHVSDMLAVADAPWLRERQNAFIDLWRVAWCGRAPIDGGVFGFRRGYRVRCQLRRKRCFDALRSGHGKSILCGQSPLRPLGSSINRGELRNFAQQFVC